MSSVVMHYVLCCHFGFKVYSSACVGEGFTCRFGSVLLRSDLGRSCSAFFLPARACQPVRARGQLRQVFSGHQASQETSRPASPATMRAVVPPKLTARWRDLKRDPLNMDDLRTAATEGRLVEYHVYDRASDAAQGVALAALGRTGQATAQGAWYECVHLAASDRNYHNYASNLSELGEKGKFLMHFCAKVACKARTSRTTSIAHVSHFRLLTLKDATVPSVNLKYAQTALVDYAAALQGLPLTGIDVGSSADENATDVEDAALAGLLGDAPDPRHASGLDAGSSARTAESVWAQAMRGRDSSGRPAVDPALARQLAAADGQVATDLRTLGHAAGPGLHGDQAAPGGDQRSSASLALLDQDQSTTPEMTGRSSGFVGATTGAQMEAGLAARAAKFSAKRKVDAPAAGGPPNKRQAVEVLLTALGSSDSGAGALTPLELCETNGQFSDHLDSQAGMFGAQMGSVVSTPLLVDRHPGELFRLALTRIKARLSTIHGTEALAEDGRRVLKYYHEVLFKPTLHPQAASRAEAHDREMQTLATAMDCILEGSLGRGADILMARYKSLEEHSRTGVWDVANELEAIAYKDNSIVTEGERHRAAALQLRRSRLQQSLASVRREG